MKKNVKNRKKKYLHIRKGDNVEVIAGNDLGLQGEVVRTIPESNQVVVEDVNVHFVHEKAGTHGRRQGERVEKEMPVDVSNVMLLCSNKGCERSGKPVRIKWKVQDDGSKTRLCVKCDHPVENV